MTKQSLGILEIAVTETKVPMEEAFSSRCQVLIILVSDTEINAWRDCMITPSVDREIIIGIVVDSHGRLTRKSECSIVFTDCEVSSNPTILVE